MKTAVLMDVISPVQVVTRTLGDVLPIVIVVAVCVVAAVILIRVFKKKK